MPNNMKQKVIALLEPYRDKTLSFGCEVMVELGDVVQYSRKNDSRSFSYHHSPNYWTAVVTY